MSSNDGEAVSGRPTRSLFRKYFLALFGAVLFPLLLSGGIEAWLGVRDQRALLDSRLRVEATAAAGRIRTFLDGIRDQLGWAVHMPWTDGGAEDHRIDALRLLRQVPAIVELALMDGAGVERLRVSRIGGDQIDSRADRSADPAFVGARASGTWFGPVTLHRDSEPRMTVALAGNRAAAGVAAATVNLTLIWDIVSAIRVGGSGLAFVMDESGQLVAHPDIGLVLRGGDPKEAGHRRRLLAEIDAAGNRALTTTDASGRRVLAAMAPVSGVDWTVVAEQPLAEAYAPIYASFGRTALLAGLGALLAAALAYLLARRMARPIALLESGAAEIGQGRFDHRIAVVGDDELGRLTARFNEMAAELAMGRERAERIARLKRFLSPQVAEIVDSAADHRLLEPRRADVAVVFCDLRGFTAFSAANGPDEVMSLLAEYYAALGDCVTRHRATLTQLSGDGVMVLVNAPLPCAGDPAIEAARMALDMLENLSRSLLPWRSRAHAIGVGIGLARGEVTVGRVGYEGRSDYTAIGNVVNLAARLCAEAADGQILIDAAAAATVSGELALDPLGSRRLKGYADAVPVFSVGCASPETGRAARG